VGDFKTADIPVDDDVDVYIVDEASMMTADTFEMVLRLAVARVPTLQRLSVMQLGP
jgi:hypothetical protein